ncbi:hypothetical protein Poly24_48340 [Rosistilla carotiformis]|uniref:Glycosyl hydrolase-like 10 domain-containing protein n=1 Tax=Rosistilla carotiformis TaxID=2528017 RepID=A0A518JZX6_9BACT|nr:hypothetical protein [Rosistilla carotiformis]QDV71101.1 hypothetical protein Poly24_48340 [Rosistilla carotiformis]
MLHAAPPQPFAQPTRVAEKRPAVQPFQEVLDQRRAAAKAVQSVGYKRVWVQWESKRPQRVTGKFALDGSEIINFRRLGIVGDEVAAVQQAGDEIDVFAATPHTQGGFAFESELTSSTRLMFGLQGDQAADTAAKTHQVDLATLGKTAAVFELPGGLVVKAHVEPLPTKLIYSRPHLIFAPGESFRFEVLLDEVPSRPHTKVHFAATLTPARGGTPLAEVAQDVMTDALGQFQDLRDFAIPMPTTEGAYEIDLKITSSSNTTSRDGTLLHSRRKVQVLVVDESNAPSDEIDTTAWKLLEEVDLDQLALADTPPRRDAARTDRHPVGQATTRAVRIAGADAGKPHILELECQGNEPAEYYVSVLRVAGKSPQVMVDSQFRIDEQSGAVARHQLVFWPDADDVAIEVTRWSDASQPSSTRLHIYAGPATLPEVSSRGISGQRGVVAYLDSPETGARFGATHLQSPTAKDLKDWKYYWESTARQAQLLNNAGYTAAMITVAGRGGSIYPSNHIEPSMLYDNGERIPDGGGSPRKDVLELMFRMFDRHQLVLIPTVRFDFPLAALEQQILAGDHSIRLRNDQQQTWWEAYPDSGPQGPYYNPAHPAVQAAIQQVVQELVDGYSRHASFGGVAVVVDQQTYLQFPGAAWGTDPRVHAEASAVLKQGKADAKSGSLEGPALRAWCDGQLKGLFANLGKTLAAGDARHKLFVIDQIQQPTEAHRRLQRTFSGTQPAASRIVWVAESQSHAAGGSSRRGDGDDGEFASGGSRAIPLNKQANLLLASDGPIQHIGSAGRADWIPRIAASDPDLIVHALPDLSLGRIDARRNLFAAFGTLPCGRFDPIKRSKDADPTVMLRSAASTVARYGYIINNSAWATDVQIRFDDLADVKVQTVCDAAIERPSDNVWQVRVAPFDIVSFRVPKADVQIVDWSMQRDQADAKEMRQWLTTLDRHLDAAKNLQLEESTLLPNADFAEVDSQDSIVGWDLAHGAGMTLELVQDDSETDRALCIQTETPRGWPTPPIGWARSQTFASPESGRMLCIARVRAEDDFAKTRLKMVVNGQIGDRVYEESIWIDGSMPTSERRGHELATDSPYRQAGIQILDIASNPENRLQVSFEVHDGGKVWIDQVAIFDRFMTSEEVADVQSMRDAAFAGIRESDFGPFLALKRSRASDTLLTQVPVVLSDLPPSSELEPREVVASLTDAASESPALSPLLASSEPDVGDSEDRSKPTATVAAGQSSRRTAANTAPLGKATPLVNMSRRAAKVDALDALDFGMIGSEPVPPSSRTFAPVALATTEAKQTQAAQHLHVSDRTPVAKPSLGQRIARWFRGDSDSAAEAASPVPVSDGQAEADDAGERISGFQFWKSRKK